MCVHFPSFYNFGTILIVWYVLFSVLIFSVICTMENLLWKHCYDTIVCNTAMKSVRSIMCWCVLALVMFMHASPTTFTVDGDFILFMIKYQHFSSRKSLLYNHSKTTIQNMGSWYSWREIKVWKSVKIRHFIKGIINLKISNTT